VSKDLSMAHRAKSDREKRVEEGVEDERQEEEDADAS
jgi:hypothetical protein